MKRAASRFILLALALGAFAIGTSEFSGMTLLPFYAREFGRDQPTAAHAVSLYALGVVVGAPLLALATARLNRLTAAALLVAAAAIGNLLSAVAGSYGWLLLARFLSGVPHGAYFGQAALIASALMPKRRGAAIALVMTGLTIATVIGAPAANMLGQTVGWRAGFGIAAHAGVISAALLACQRHSMPAAEPVDVRTELAIIRNPQVWLTLGTGAVGFGGLFAFYAYLPAIAQDVAGLSPGIVPWLLAVVGAGMVGGNIVSGWASDRFGAAWAFWPGVPSRWFCFRSPRRRRDR